MRYMVSIVLVAKLILFFPVSTDSTCLTCFLCIDTALDCFYPGSSDIVTGPESSKKDKRRGNGSVCLCSV